MMRVHCYDLTAPSVRYVPVDVDTDSASVALDAAMAAILTALTALVSGEASPCAKP